MYKKWIQSCIQGIICVQFYPDGMIKTAVLIENTFHIHFSVLGAIVSYNPTFDHWMFFNIYDQSQ